MDKEKLLRGINRVYSIVDIKEFDDEKREFIGIATTPSTDRMNDIVEPDGAKYTLPIPLLWQHDRSAPIGKILSAKKKKNGIEVRCSIAKIDSPPSLKERLDEAWESLKHELVRGLSIGFAPIEYSFMDNGGIHFTAWDWLELSLVTIPANAEANITSVKAYDKQLPTASGPRQSVVVTMIPPPGDSGDHSKILPMEGIMKIQEQIKGFEETRRKKAAEMAAIMEKAGESGMTLDQAQAEAYDALKAEVKAIDEHIARLKDLEKANVVSAETVDDKSGMQERGKAVAKVTEKLSPGIEFARFAMCLGAAKGNLNTAAAIAAKRFPHSERVNIALKAAVEAGTTTHSTWALPLVEYTQFAGDFVEFLRPATILGKFGRDGIPALRSIPFNVHVRGQTNGGSGYWVGQGKPKPLTKFAYNDVYMGYTKVANIAVLTEELLRFSNPSAEMLVRDSLAAALIERLDTDFIDPTLAAVANVSPASITHGVAQIQASGTGDADDIRTDVKAAMATFIAANITPSSGVWIMSSTTALALSLMRNALGQKEFPDITMMGGRFEGLPVIASEYVPTDSDGGFVFLVNASDVWLADDGVVTIDASREASLEMLDSALQQNAPAGTGASLVSMFQSNSVALRAERWINWQKRRAAGVAVIAAVAWGS